MLGQAHHFNVFAPEKVPYGIKRYSDEAVRLYGVLDRRLAESQFLGSNEYSIADIATWPWTRYPERQGVDTAKLQNFRRWFEAIAARPAVQRGQQRLEDNAEVMFARRDFLASAGALAVVPLFAFRGVGDSRAPKANPWPLWDSHDPDSQAEPDYDFFHQFLNRYLVEAHADDPLQLTRFAYARVEAPQRRQLADFNAALAEVQVLQRAKDAQFVYWLQLV